MQWRGTETHQDLKTWFQININKLAKFSPAKTGLPFKQSLLQAGYGTAQLQHARVVVVAGHANRDSAQQGCTQLIIPRNQLLGMIL